MNCPSCTKAIPGNSTFCMHCGKSINVPSAITSEPTPWEYKHFIWHFPPNGKSMWVRLGSGAYSEAGAKLEFWQNYQQEIYTELQKWQDEGWEPVGEVGPACIEIKTTKDYRDKNALYWIMVVILTILSGGLVLILVLIFGTSLIAVPTQFNLRMRRTRRDTGMQDAFAKSDQPAVINIRRKSQATGALRTFGVFIDHKQIEKLGSGETKKIETKAGNHTIFVQMGSSKSEVLTFELEPGKTIGLVCQMSTLGGRFMAEPSLQIDENYRGE